MKSKRPITPILPLLGCGDLSCTMRGVSQNVNMAPQ